MITTPRQYRSAPPPPPPDEDYWAALLAQEEEEAENLAYAEEGTWTKEIDFKKTLVDDTRQLAKVDDWKLAEQAYAGDLTLDLMVVGYNKGGLLVEWNSLRGFVPSSQLVENLGRADTNLHHPLAKYVGQRIALRIIELSREQNRLILSERAAQVSSGTRANILHTLKPHQQYRGIVTNVCNFGVFVDLGGVEGLIHISELSWGRVEHPAEILQRGQEVTVYIMDVTPDRGRIALSLKRLQPDPWLTVEKRYHVGQHVEATITSVVDFGAFAALEEGLEGLIHISELAEGHFLHPRNVVREGERVRVRILNIDNHARRVGLSLRTREF